MKLKKIASLMLAGIMAVSMLAGCKSGTPDPNPGEGEQGNTTSSFTDAVLDKTMPVTKTKLSAEADETLSKAVAFAAANNTYGNYVASLTAAIDGSKIQYDAAKIMTGKKLSYIRDALNPTNKNKWDFTNINEDQTYWTLYVVSSEKSDEWIAGELASRLDTVAKTMNDAEKSDEETWNYTVSIVKADMATEDGVKVDGAVLIGIAVAVDYETINY